MKLLIGIISTAFAMTAAAQTCDVTYSFESETMDGRDVGSGSITLKAQPLSEVEFQHKLQLKVLDAMSKEQDASSKEAKGKKWQNANEEPKYKVDVSEFRSCDGGPKVKNTEGSLSLQGLSYAGSTRIGDEVLRQGKALNDHHKAKVAKGEKAAWDHAKAKKVERDDLGNKKQ